MSWVIWNERRKRVCILSIGEDLDDRIEGEGKKREGTTDSKVESCEGIYSGVLVFFVA